jgi:hypothetical protein
VRYQTSIGLLNRLPADRDWRKKHDDLTPSDHAPVWADLELAG